MRIKASVFRAVEASLYLLSYANVTHWSLLNPGLRVGRKENGKEVILVLGPMKYSFKGVLHILSKVNTLSFV